jgi:hypothetical protein
MSVMNRTVIPQFQQWHERAEHLSRFLDDTCDWLNQQLIDPRTAPTSVPEPEQATALQGHPFCASCRVPLWVISIDRSSGRAQWNFECKRCGTMLASPQHGANDVTVSDTAEAIEAAIAAE